MNVQAEVEQPEIHLLALCSSSVEDQTRLIGDRLSCLLELSEPVKKQGGTYKCGVCGCQEYLFDDQAHTLQHKWRSPQQLQTLAISGRFGRQPGALRPFDLRVKELRSELEARGVVLDSKMLRADLQLKLNEILRGVARVPALLLTNPTQQLASLNLGKYEIVASEPLHDIKGHVINLINEMPTILPPGETRSKCIHLIDSCLAKEKKSGADLRRVAIQLYLLLKDLDCSSRVLFLLQSIIKIGEIAYSRDDKRCPRQLLQLYNMCWIHMELCRDLLSQPEKISKTKMFGHYVHAITAHIATQHELACLRSLNTESEERLFGQARAIADYCTNHHPENVIPHVMLRLQAKQEQHDGLASVKKGDSQVSRVAADLPQLPGTRVKTSFIQQREDSWQIHLQRISPFLVAGVDVWWSYTGNGFLFHDGDTDRANAGDTFSLLHHRYHSVMDVEHRRDACWKRIVDEKIVIPAHSIKLYDSDGKKTGRLLYRDHTVTLECSDPLETSTTEAEAFPNLCAHDSDPLPFNEALSCTPSPLVNEDTQGEQSTAGHIVVEETSAVSQTQTETEVPDVLVDEGTSNTTPAVAEMCSTEPNSTFINLNLDEGLKTSAGNSIKRLLGCDDDLVKFDDFRFKLKNAKRTGGHIHKTSISEYREMVGKFKTKVKLVQSERADKLKEMERKQFQLTGKLPAKTPGSHYYNILKERNLATNILRIL